MAPNSIILSRSNLSGSAIAYVPKRLPNVAKQYRPVPPTFLRIIVSQPQPGFTPITSALKGCSGVIFPSLHNSSSACALTVKSDNTMKAMMLWCIFISWRTVLLTDRSGLGGDTRPVVYQGKRRPGSADLRDLGHEGFWSRSCWRASKNWIRVKLTRDCPKGWGHQRRGVSSRAGRSWWWRHRHGREGSGRCGFRCRIRADGSPGFAALRRGKLRLEDSLRAREMFRLDGSGSDDGVMDCT